MINKSNKVLIILVLVILCLLLNTLVHPRLLEYRRAEVLEQARIYTVEEILTPETVLLTDVENGEQLTFRLLGIEPVDSPDINGHDCMLEMMRLVYHKTVHITYDPNIRFDENGTPYGYLYYADAWYLLNASLIDRGFATVDRSVNHWLKDEFLRLERNLSTTTRGYDGIDTENPEISTEFPGEEDTSEGDDNVIIQVIPPDGDAITITEQPVDTTEEDLLFLSDLGILLDQLAEALEEYSMRLAETEEDIISYENQGFDESQIEETLSELAVIGAGLDDAENTVDGIALESQNLANSSENEELIDAAESIIQDCEELALWIDDLQQIRSDLEDRARSLEQQELTPETESLILSLEDIDAQLDDIEQLLHDIDNEIDDIRDVIDGSTSSELSTLLNRVDAILNEIAAAQENLEDIYYNLNEILNSEYANEEIAGMVILLSIRDRALYEQAEALIEEINELSTELEETMEYVLAEEARNRIPEAVQYWAWGVLEINLEMIRQKPESEDLINALYQPEVHAFLRLLDDIYSDSDMPEPDKLTYIVKNQPGSEYQEYIAFIEADFDAYFLREKLLERFSYADEISDIPYIVMEGSIRDMNLLFGISEEHGLFVSTPDFFYDVMYEKLSQPDFMSELTYYQETNAFNNSITLWFGLSQNWINRFYNTPAIRPFAYGDAFIIGYDPGDNEQVNLMINFESRERAITAQNNVARLWQLFIMQIAAIVPGLSELENVISSEIYNNTSVLINIEFDSSIQQVIEDAVGQ